MFASDDSGREGPGPGRLGADVLSALREYVAARLPPENRAAAEVREPPAELSEYLARAGAPFSRRLLQLIRESGLSEVEVYRRAHVDRKLFSKIRSDPAYQPRKTTAVAFALALRLTAEETHDLLVSAGFALSASSPFDLIIRFFIERGVYDLLMINDALYAFGQPIFAV
ncbi:MAG: hypothetical protein PHG71_05630 [Kiritimatiellae bacterium]|nr:hypothetical protein [Kiritimatiellia bacterium]